MTERTDVIVDGVTVARLTTEDIHISDSGLPFPIHPHAKREQPNNPTEP